MVRNPYDTSRTTAGSSGGSAAGVSTSFGLVAVGTDTGNEYVIHGVLVLLFDLVRGWLVR